MRHLIAVLFIGLVGATPPTPAPSAPPADPCTAMLALLNRPTIAFSPCSVETGKALIESGYTNVVTGGSSAGNSVYYPQAAVRIGTASPKLEFDVVPPSYNRTTAGGALVRGWGDLGIGAQYTFGYTDRFVSGANVLITVPNGAPGITAGNAQFTGNYNWSYALGSVFGTFGTVGFNALSGPDGQGQPRSYFTFVPSVGISEALPGKSQVFAEYAYYSQGAFGAGEKHVFDFGYMRQIGSHVVLDLNYGFAPVTRSLPNQHYLGVGLSLMN